MSHFKQLVIESLEDRGSTKVWLSRKLNWGYDMMLKRLNSDDWNWSWIRDISKALGMHPCTFLNKAKKLEEDNA
jgi:hypothetical protein